MSVQAKVIKITHHPDTGVKPVITMQLRYPRIIHGEVMTHREFERNGRSSRAVPVKTMLKEVWKNPFIPDYIGANRPGMQAGEEVWGFKRWVVEKIWKTASKVACVAAWSMLKLGIHKQIPNRLLEPFSYIDTLVTSCSFDNFFALRIHPDAEPHMNALALEMFYALDDYQHHEYMEMGGTHLPYVNYTEDCARVIEYLQDNNMKVSDKAVDDMLLKLSVVRCARISYRPFDGKADVASELSRYHKLIEARPVHASPAGHQAICDFKAEHKVRKMVKGVRKYVTVKDEYYSREHLKGCLHKGWVQYRKMLPDEYVDTYKHKENIS